MFTNVAANQKRALDDVRKMTNTEINSALKQKGRWFEWYVDMLKKVRAERKAQ